MFWYPVGRSAYLQGIPLWGATLKNRPWIGFENLLYSCFNLVWLL